MYKPSCTFAKSHTGKYLSNAEEIIIKIFDKTGEMSGGEERNYPTLNKNF